MATLGKVEVGIITSPKFADYFTTKQVQDMHLSIGAGVVVSGVKKADDLKAIKILQELNFAREARFFCGANGSH